MDQSQDHEEFKEVYAHFGLTFYMANVLEHAMADFLVLLEIPHIAEECRNKQEFAELVDQRYENEFSKTLGKLKNALQKQTSLDNAEINILEILNECNNVRNYLAHHFWREYAVDFATHGGRKKMINHLAYWRKIFDEAEKSVSRLSRPLAEKCGITEEWIEDHIRHMTEESPITL